MAEVGEQLAGVLVRRSAVVVYRRAGHDVPDGPADAKPARRSAGVTEEALPIWQRGQGVHVTGIVAGHSVEQRGGVGDRPRDRPVGAEADEVRHKRAMRYTATARLYSEQAAHAGRDTNRPAAVAAL